MENRKLELRQTVELNREGSVAGQQLEDPEEQDDVIVTITYLDEDYDVTDDSCESPSCKNSEINDVNVATRLENDEVVNMENSKREVSQTVELNQAQPSHHRTPWSTT